MAKEPLYDWVDSKGKARVIMVVSGTGDVGGSAKNFTVLVTDVEDTKTGERFTAIPFASLKLRTAK